MVVRSEELGVRSWREAVQFGARRLGAAFTNILRPANNLFCYRKRRNARFAGASPALGKYSNRIALANNVSGSRA